MTFGWLLKYNKLKAFLLLDCSVICEIFSREWMKKLTDKIKRQEGACLFMYEVKIVSHYPHLEVPHDVQIRHPS